MFCIIRGLLLSERVLVVVCPVLVRHTLVGCIVQPDYLTPICIADSFGFVPNRSTTQASPFSTNRIFTIKVNLCFSLRSSVYLSSCVFGFFAVSLLSLNFLLRFFGMRIYCNRCEWISFRRRTSIESHVCRRRVNSLRGNFSIFATDDWFFCTSRYRGNFWAAARPRAEIFVRFSF